MPQNPHFPPSGTSVYTGEVVHSEHPSADSSLPRPQAVVYPESPLRDSSSQLPSQNPSSSRDDSQVPDVPESSPWTDEDYVQYAEQRFGSKFSPAAARAFHDFDDKSHHVQAAEFYRFRDEHYEKHGYF